MIIIKPIDFAKNLPNTFHKKMALGPYLLPIFGNIYFGRIKKIIRIFQRINKTFTNIIEIGGGFGLFGLNFKLNFPESKFTILDLYDSEFFYLVKKVHIKSYNTKIQYIPNCDIQYKTSLDDNCFDLAFALDVFEHIYEINDALDELLRILKINGYLFISVPTEGKIIRVIRNFWNFVKKVNTNPHWNGPIDSESKFHKLLESKKIQILMEIRYPIKFLPRIFSYDIFYLIRKVK